MSQGSNKPSHATFKWLAGVLATVISGVAVFWLTEGTRSTQPAQITNTSQGCSNANSEGLLQASMSGELSKVQDFLRCGVNPNSRAVWEQELPDNKTMELTATPLHAASWNKHTGIVQTLIDADANVDALNEWGFSPLMAAAEVDAIDAVGFLINAGAEVNLVANCLDCIGETALTIAAQSGHSGVVELLLRSGANVAHQQDDGSTALDLAMQENHAEIVQLLQAQ